MTFTYWTSSRRIGSPWSVVQQLKECFVRITQGEWFCRAPCTLEGPMGAVNVTPGVSYRRGRVVDGLEVAAVLDDRHLTGRLPPDVTVR